MVVRPAPISIAATAEVRLKRSATHRSARRSPRPRRCPSARPWAATSSSGGWRGADGDVYAAYDRRLERSRAQAPPRGADGSRCSAQEERLLREAQAIGDSSPQRRRGRRRRHHKIGRRPRLRGHGVHRRAKRWPPGSGGERAQWREVRDVFLPAGQRTGRRRPGGSVHRDFKPQNVMIGHDGTVRVMGFGLAATGERRSGGSDTGHHLGTRRGAVRDPDSARATTRRRVARNAGGYGTGAVPGRPGGRRSDQFSFCVALLEGLYGEIEMTRRQWRPALPAGPRAHRRGDAAVPAWDPPSRCGPIRCSPSIDGRTARAPRRSGAPALGMVAVSVAAGLVRWLSRRARQVAGRGQRRCQGGDRSLGLDWETQRDGACWNRCPPRRPSSPPVACWPRRLDAASVLARRSRPRPGGAAHTDVVR